MQRVGGRPVIRRPLHIVQYRDMKCHDISISLLGYDMITSFFRTSVTNESLMEAGKQLVNK